MREEMSEAVVSYIMSFLLALALSLLLWDIFILYIFFKYGDVERTKLNKLPFVIMIFGLICSSIEAAALLLTQENITDYVLTFDVSVYYECLYYHKFFWFNNVIWINRVLKVYFLDIFVLVFAYEMFTLLRMVFV
jgi:hypothetical protein